MLFQFIPIGQNNRFSRAQNAAIERNGGDAMINTQVQESWFWAWVLNGYKTRTPKYYGFRGIYYRHVEKNYDLDLPEIGIAAPAVGSPSNVQTSSSSGKGMFHRFSLASPNSRIPPPTPEKRNNSFLGRRSIADSRKSSVRSNVSSSRKNSKAEAKNFFKLLNSSMKDFQEVVHSSMLFLVFVLSFVLF